ncbi:hypothetical protein FQY83_14230 [Luteimonas marina]|uniref:Uncharacterized protein n=1 Tax=Luteimonas marina TaxID=488485 RepID=A0A5C5TWF3_9GAMM|nr:hypothetical protein [Luteimonas marina]TWT18533.1 hypothetical protein FQY83_14230 [Luteimonas marina]
MTQHKRRGRLPACIGKIVEARRKRWRTSAEVAKPAEQKAAESAIEYVLKNLACAAEIVQTFDGASRQRAVLPPAESPRRLKVVDPAADRPINVRKALSDAMADLHEAALKAEQRAAEIKAYLERHPEGGES